MSPVATAIKTVYLTLNGGSAPASTPTGLTRELTGYIDKTVKLAPAFTDDESPAGLTYTAVSKDKTIAKTDAATTTNAVGANGELKITGVAAGETTITVTAFDGVNAGVETTFDVIVVADNTPPAVSVTRYIGDLTGVNKLRSASALEVHFAAVIKPGVVGEDEGITFREVVGPATSTKYVTAKAKAGTGIGNYILTVKRISTTALNDKSESNEITIFAVDSFGAETEVDLNGPVVTVATVTTGVANLVVGVNAPPRVSRPLPSVVYLYRGDDAGAAVGNLMADNNVLGLAGKPSVTWFSVTDFFAVEMKLDAANTENDVDDTTCTFSTTPGQPTGAIWAVPAVPAVAAENNTPAVPAMPKVAAAPITKATKATVTNGAAVRASATAASTTDHHYPASLVHTSATDAARARVVVNSNPVMYQAPTVGVVIPPVVNAEGTGSFTLTITCRDGEKSVSSSSTISVAN